MHQIQITIHVDGELFSASASWGTTAWKRDPVEAIRELVGKAIPFANHVCMERKVSPFTPPASTQEIIGTKSDVLEMEKAAQIYANQCQADPETY